MPDFIKESLDGSKLQFHLIPAGVEVAIVRVLMFGAKKYAPDNWKNADTDTAIEQYSDAIRRHLCAILDGEWRDQETGELHAAHIATNAMFLHWHLSKAE